VQTVQYRAFGGPDVIQIVDLPEPEPRDGEVVIRVAAVGMNFADVLQRQGRYIEPIPLPFIPGAEVAGTIAALGPDVAAQTSLRAGMRVMAVTGEGGYAQYVVAPAAIVAPIPEGMDFIQAAAFPLQGLTAYHLLYTAARFQAGETVLVHAAAGGVGTLAVQMARNMGAGQIIATASSAAKLALAQQLGATAGIDYTQEDFAARVNELTGGYGADVVLDAVGGEVLERSLQCLAPFGRLVVYGMASGKEATIAPIRLAQHNHAVIGFYLPGVASRPDRYGASLSAVIDMILQHEIELIVEQTYPLVAAAEAQRQMEARQVRGKVVLLP
jgi:NADPH2:quinone reductase